MSLKKCEGCGRPMGIFALIGEGEMCRSCLEIEEFAGRIGKLLVAAIAEVKQEQKPARYIPKVGDTFYTKSRSGELAGYVALFVDEHVVFGYDINAPFVYTHYSLAGSTFKHEVAA